MSDHFSWTHVCDTCRDKPGSDTAAAKGCICPRLDNGRGHNTERAVIVVGCPVHHLSLKETQ